MLGLQVSAILAASARVVLAATPTPSSDASALGTTPTPSETAHLCKENEWYWKAKKDCLPISDNAVLIAIPRNFECPFGWKWHALWNHCAPPGPTGLQIQNRCPRGTRWVKSLFLCQPHIGKTNVPTLDNVAIPTLVDSRPSTSSAPPDDQNPCGPGKWFWQAKAVCFPEEIQPLDIEAESAALLLCPRGWGWSEGGYCFPRRQSDVRNKCPTTASWNNDLLYCVAKPCLPPEWLWEAKNVCLPHYKLTMAHHQMKPPEGKICPTEWYWRPDFGHCVPPQKRALTFNCEDRRYAWDNAEFICMPKPVLPPGPSQCDASQWFWAVRYICLPYRVTGLYASPPPLSSHIKCPLGWYWMNEHCIPPRPDSLTVIPCPKGHRLDKSNAKFICNPIS